MDALWQEWNGTVFSGCSCWLRLDSQAANSRLGSDSISHIVLIFLPCACSGVGVPLNKDLEAQWAAVLGREVKTQCQNKECVLASLGYAEPGGSKQGRAKI